MIEIEDLIKSKYQNEEINNLVFEFISKDSNNLNYDIEFKLLCKKYSIVPSKNEIRKVYQNNFSEIKISNNMKRWMIKKVTRSESGVLVVTIVTKPGNNVKFSCPEKCAYCPTETDLHGKPTQPKSYISTEPAMMRALHSNFDIKGQVNDRLKSYINTGNIKEI